MKSILQSATEREKLLLEGYRNFMLGKLTRGQLLRQLRKSVLGMNQTAFAQLAGVSRRSLTQIENDACDFSEETLNRVFKIFGLRVGLQLRSEYQVRKLLERQN
ncbi:helix-turn-helix transcriptional regulator [Alteromonas sp. ASW11-36]|uniref:Helix-turn-helix transcriptional regulator n=1 Tax=Alteromonas arenosi TaxID=3055817 RepID=A0ABT7T0W6_9ALTE|nr:helix-turn-helix transcriptional regulator [Alteromonas sp. ASW11-36]MDM7862089.1 helix-turn-helix transcriptional regulator [Alteromonas sp. ASW11-36]